MSYPSVAADSNAASKVEGTPWISLRKRMRTALLLGLDAKVAQLHGDDARDALLLLRDAVDEIRTRNRVLVVGDDQELALREELLQLLDEAPDVRVIEGRVQLVQHAERRRLDHEDREEERDRRHRALAAREERHRLRTLPRRTRDDVDAALERILLVLQEDEPRLAAAEEPREHRLEVLVRRLERRPEHVPRRVVQVADQLQELRLRRKEVLLLRLLLRVALLELAALVDRDHVDRPERGDLGLQTHLGEDHVLTVARFDTTGVNHGKGGIKPGNIRINTVSGNTGCIFYNTDSLSRKSIKQSRFTNIWSTDNCYYRLRHKPFPLLYFLLNAYHSILQHR